MVKSLVPRSRMFATMPSWETGLFDDRFRRMFETFEPLWAEPMGWAPPLDFYETKDEFILTAELPGMKSDEVDVSIENNILTLTGEKHFEEEREEDKRHILERRYGSFQRALTLPASVEEDKVFAEYKDGVLTLTLPKSAKAKGRRIAIKEVH